MYFYFFLSTFQFSQIDVRLRVLKYFFHVRIKRVNVCSKRFGQANQRCNQSTIVLYSRKISIGQCRLVKYGNYCNKRVGFVVFHIRLHTAQEVEMITIKYFDAMEYYQYILDWLGINLNPSLQKHLQPQMQRQSKPHCATETAR